MQTRTCTRGDRQSKPDPEYYCTFAACSMTDKSGCRGRLGSKSGIGGYVGVTTAVLAGSWGRAGHGRLLWRLPGARNGREKRARGTGRPHQSNDEAKRRARTLVWHLARGIAARVGALGLPTTPGRQRLVGRAVLEYARGRPMRQAKTLYHAGSAAGRGWESAQSVLDRAALRAASQAAPSPQAQRFSGLSA